MARLALPMAGIGIITMLSQLRGAYALAGAVAATFSLSTALLAPWISRRVDRHGQTGAAAGGGPEHPGAGGLAAGAHGNWPDWTLFVCAAAAGVMPSMPAMVRARWSALYRDQPLLRTAFALESVLDEVTLIVGPPLAVGLSVAWFQAGPLAAAALLAVGITAFSLQTRTAPPLNPARAGREPTVLGVAALRKLTFMLAAMGVIVGVIDVMSVAVATRQGVPAGASIVLSVYALGSCLAGLAFGAMRLSMPLPRMLAIAGAMTAATTLPLLWVDDLLGLSLAVLAAGVSFAPTMIIAMGMAEAAAPAHRLTESLTWLITGLFAGVAAGAALAGWLVDMHGIRAGFGAAVGAGAAVLAIVLSGALRGVTLARLRRPERRADADRIPGMRAAGRVIVRRTICPEP